MRRRTFLLSTAAAGAVALIKPTIVGAVRTVPDWADLKRRLGERLIDINSPLVECVRNHGAGADELFATLKNPYYLSDEPSLTQSLGWIDAWTSQPSIKGVAAQSAVDFAAAIDFCQRTGIPPVIKGGGHSYFGNSNRAGSLLIWTHRMRSIELDDAFRPAGSPPGTRGTPAVSVGAGCLWGEVYRKVAVEHGRYVQGGGCLTVGVAGFVQGGGFGSLSKQFGTGAANLLEAEVVTADGRIRTVNRWNEPELFFALRGGGGGTFGVVTRLTIKTHPLPANVGVARLEIRAKDAVSWRSLVGRMVDFYADHLFNPSWGEQIRFAPRYQLKIDMVCHGLSQDEMATVWAPFISWAKARAQDFEFASEPSFLVIPVRALWDPAVLRTVPGLILQDDRPGALSDNIYWAGNRGEAGQVLHAYQSAWLPNRLLDRSRRPSLARAMARAGEEWDITWHLNKWLGGGSPGAIAATLETATNPEVVDSFALVICAAEEQPAWPGIPGHEPNVAEGRRQAAGVTRRCGKSTGSCRTPALTCRSPTISRRTGNGRIGDRTIAGSSRRSAATIRSGCSAATTASNPPEGIVGMDARNIVIPVGGEHVSGLLFRPPGARALYLFAHGAGAGMTHKAMESNAHGLAEREIATLRYQFLYIEKGSRRPDSPKVAHAAVRAAAAKANELADLPLFAGGRSFGGRMTSQAQAIEPLPGVRGLAFLGFPLHPAGKPGIERAEHLERVEIPMLFVSGDRDALAELDLLRGVVASLGSRATLHLVEHADHSFKVAARSGRTSADAEAEALDALAKWMLERSA